MGRGLDPVMEMESSKFVKLKMEFPASLAGDRVTKVSCGSNHNVALTEKGRVFSWGLGGKYQLGHHNKKNYASPKLIESLQSTLIQQVDCGGDSCLALSGREEDNLFLSRFSDEKDLIK